MSDAFVAARTFANLANKDLTEAQRFRTRAYEPVPDSTQTMGVLRHTTASLDRLAVQIGKQLDTSVVRAKTSGNGFVVVFTPDASAVVKALAHDEGIGGWTTSDLRVLHRAQSAPAATVGATLGQVTDGTVLALGAAAAFSLGALVFGTRKGTAARGGLDLSSLDLVERTERPGPGMDPIRWATGVPVTFQFAHNTEPSAYFGDEYGQDVEPAGRYVVTLGVKPENLPPGWIHGRLHFDSPIVLASVWPVEHSDGTWGRYAGPQGWKHKLSATFGGKTGLALTRAILAAGHDGIVTVSMSGPGNEPGYIAEIVDLKTTRKRRPSRNLESKEQEQQGMLECAWCGGLVYDKPYRNRRDEVFCCPSHRDASNRALKRLLQRTNP